MSKLKNNIRITNSTNIPRLFRKIIRELAGVKHPYPVRIIAGDGDPKLIGSPYHYENKSGELIHHPTAYRRAWGKPIYIASTLEVVVGNMWFNKNLTLKDIKVEKLKAFK